MYFFEASDDDSQNALKMFPTEKQYYTFIIIFFIRMIHFNLFMKV
jgi:hypothetical protein